MSRFLADVSLQQHLALKGLTPCFMSQQNVSAVVVNWNTKKFLLQCVESLIEHSRAEPVEIVVVDNGSSDGSQQALRDRFPSVQLIAAGANLGFARGTNLGAKASAGRYVMFVNSDTKAFPCCIGTLVHYMESHPDVGMITPRIIGADGKSQHVVGRLLSLSGSLSAAFGIYRENCPCCRQLRGRGAASPGGEEVDLLMLCFAMLRREAMDQVGLLDEDFFFYGEDVDYSKRFRDKGWKLVYLPSASTFHYGGGSSERAPVRFYIELLRARLQYFRKHHGVWGSWLCRGILLLHMAIRLGAYAPKGLLRGATSRESARIKVARSWAAIRWLLTGKQPAVT